MVYSISKFIQSILAPLRRDVAWWLDLVNGSGQVVSSWVQINLLQPMPYPEGIGLGPSDPNIFGLSSENQDDPDFFCGRCLFRDQQNYNYNNFFHGQLEQ